MRAMSIQFQNILNYVPLSHSANQILSTLSMRHYYIAVMEHIIPVHSSSQLLCERPVSTGKEHDA